MSWTNARVGRERGVTVTVLVGWMHEQRVLATADATAERVDRGLRKH